jgi:hypothetical protein
METINNPFDKRISESEIARILALISQVPNRREKPKAGDVPGNFDFWFDGGACSYITGETVFSFTDGIQATVFVTPSLSVTIRFPDGREVSIFQRLRH